MKHRLFIILTIMCITAVLIAGCGSAHKDSGNNNGTETDDSSTENTGTPAGDNVDEVAGGPGNEGPVNLVLQTGVYIQDGNSDLFAGTFSVPAVYDWDSDGLKDLLVGYNNFGDDYGYIRFYRNTGSDSSPSFKGSTIIKACEGACSLSVYSLPGF